MDVLVEESIMTGIEIKEETTDSKFLLIGDITWKTLSSKTDNIIIIPTEHINPPVDPNSVLIGTIDIGVNTEDNITTLYLSSASHRFVYTVSINHLDSKIFTPLGKTIPGVILVQEDEENMLYSFTTFDIKKKIICWFRKESGYYYPLRIIDTTPDFVINKGLEPIKNKTRKITDKISEYDLIVCQQASNRLSRIAEDCSTIAELYDALFSILEKTIDPSYISKILGLYQKITYKTYV